MMVAPQDPGGAIEVALPDVVFVRRGLPVHKAAKTSQDGKSFGAWYVIQNQGYDRCSDPDTNFDVGHDESGMKLVGGLTFWEASRIALAMDDAGLELGVYPHRVVWLEPDIKWIIESIISSALMDHYVFPLSRYFDEAA